MPIVKKIEHNCGTLGIWKLSESAVQLKSMFRFTENEKEEFDKIKADRRKREYVAIRLLLQHLLNEKKEIKYNKSGKPRLNESNKNISISHSAELVTVFISDNRIGIDVELANRNIDKVANRFLSSEELQHIETFENQQPVKILYWSAKEAIFKCTKHGGILFSKEIRIPPFALGNEGTFKGTLFFENTPECYQLGYFFYENNVIVSCVEEKES